MGCFARANCVYDYCRAGRSASQMSTFKSLDVRNANSLALIKISYTVGVKAEAM